VGRYSEEVKEQVVRKMMPPNAQSAAQVQRQKDTLLRELRGHLRAFGLAQPIRRLRPGAATAIVHTVSLPALHGAQRQT